MKIAIEKGKNSGVGRSSSGWGLTNQADPPPLLSTPMITTIIEFYSMISVYIKKKFLLKLDICQKQHNQQANLNLMSFNLTIYLFNIVLNIIKKKLNEITLVFCCISILFCYMKSHSFDQK